MLKFDKAFRAEFRDNWIVLGVSFSCLLFAMSAPAFSLPFIFPHVIDEFGWTREQATALASVKWMSGAVAAFTVGWFVDRVGAAIALLATTTFGGLALLSFMWVPNLSMYYFSGVLLGLSGPGAMVAVKVLVSRSFHASQGTALGIALLGTSIGAVIIPFVITFLIAAFGWRVGFGALSIGIWAIALPLLLFALRFRAEAFRNKTNDTVPAGQFRTSNSKNLLALMKHRNFWLIAGAVFLAGMSDSAFVQHQVLILNDIGLSSGITALVVSSIGFLGIGARVIAGNILDGNSNKGLAVLYLTLSIASLASFLLNNPAFLIAFVVLRAMGHAAVLLDTTIMAKHTFGTESLGILIGSFMAIASIGFAIGPWLMGRLYDLNGSYNVPFIIFAALPIAASALVWLIVPRFWNDLRGIAIDPSSVAANSENLSARTKS